MPHLYTDEQRHIRDEVRRALSTAASNARLRDLLEKPGMHDTVFWQTARELGWNAMAIPEAHGGLGMGLVDSLIVAEECGRALAGAPFLATNLAVAHALTAASDPTGLLGRIADGHAIAALAFAEGSEPLPASPTTRLEEGRLFGTKTAVLGGAAADVALVLATDGGVPCLVLADLDGAGVTRDAPPTLDPSRAIAHLAFDGAPAVRLATTNAQALAGACQLRLGLFLAAESVGGADACIALSRDYANERQAFGQAIGKFQAVKHAIAEMWVLNEMARASVLDAALRLDRGDADAPAYAAAARLNAVQAYETSAASATQIHGGIGVTWEADLHLHYRRSRTLAVEAGARPYWEDLIVTVLEGKAA
ncbi:MAG: acyl-CoA/acyl-ACP dehydrogenase [Azospirillaceae bacterium]|nr:acyl-CoA/acyl-ACP dehydrogenase [Azospirillaceae bacterium]